MADITIPREALEKAARAIYDILEGPFADQDYCRQMAQWEQAEELARAACRAMLRAWPHRKDEWRDNITFDGKPVRYSVIILPLPQENNNADG